MPAAVPAVMGVASLAGGIYSANKQAGAASDAADQQMKLAQMAMQTPGYVKKSKNMLFDVLSPALQAYMQNGQLPNLMPESYTDAIYNAARKTGDESHAKGRSQLETSMENRGLGYGNVMPEALGKYDADYENQMASLGADLAYKGRMVNIQGWQDYLNKIYGIFSQGKAQQSGLIGQGLNLASDSIGANYAGQAGYYNQIGQIPSQAWGLYNMMNGGYGQSSTPSNPYADGFTISPETDYNATGR